MKKVCSPILVCLALICCFFIISNYQGECAGMEISIPPMPPTIEELTNGKVKIGDLITKDNVDLVKEYLPLGLYECVKTGMVLKMGKMIPLDQINPRYYLEATEKYKGQAVVNDHVVVRLKDGSEWPGGIPFPDPKTALEVMGNKKFGYAQDNFEAGSPMWYVNKEGKLYKTAHMKVFMYRTDGRLKVPPLGSVPGQEAYHQRFINVFVAPLELKGLGQFNINYDDDTVNYDIGFSYLPAFKRTIRISSITFQDNVGGTDFTQGDPEGLREPLGTWDFKFIGKKLILVAEPVRDSQPVLVQGGLSVDPRVVWDVGKRFPRLGWTITPVYIVEATPKDKTHVYSKKTLYVCDPYFAHAVGGGKVVFVDIFDRTGRIWKLYYDWRGTLETYKDGTKFTGTGGYTMHDLQTGHQSHSINYTIEINGPMTSEFVSLKKLLELGR